MSVGFFQEKRLTRGSWKILKLGNLGKSRGPRFRRRISAKLPKSVVFPSLSTAAICSEDRRSLKTAVNQSPSRSIDEDRNGIDEWTRTKRIAGCRTRRVYVEKRGARDQVHNDLAVVERDGTRRWVVKGGGMYTHTHGVCKPLCRGRVDGGRRGRHHNASTHTPTIPICCHAVSPLSLSLSLPFLSLIHVCLHRTLRYIGTGGPCNARTSHAYTWIILPASPA